MSTYKSPVGTADLLPEMAHRWQSIQQTAAEVFTLYNYLPIEVPTFEQLEVFTHGIGVNTDVVGKEMFQVSALHASTPDAEPDDQPQELFALRPEGTAGVTRAVIQHNLVQSGSTALKVYYAGPMFRYERPQKGRLREFHQIGVEIIGAAEPTADAEVIDMMMRFFAEIGLPTEDMLLKINSMGDDQCRPAYRESIKAFIENHPDLCPDCQRRADTNPLRAFDCKNEKCQSIMQGAPKITDALCDDCATHYQTVKDLLQISGIDYEEDHRLVRGLDYYTRTVFEVQMLSGLGSQNAIGGGGRYDRLIEILGGQPTPGLGFALGYERIALALDAAGIRPYLMPRPLIYVVAVDADCRSTAYRIASQLRESYFSVEVDHQMRSTKSQFRNADRSKAAFTVVIGPDEIANSTATIRSMFNGDEVIVTQSNLLDTLFDLVSQALEEDLVSDDDFNYLAMAFERVMLHSMMPDFTDRTRAEIDDFDEDEIMVFEFDYDEDDDDDYDEDEDEILVFEFDDDDFDFDDDDDFGDNLDDDDD